MIQSFEPSFSVEDIAKHLGVSKETIYRWLDRQKIPAHRIGKLWKFKPTEVDEWIRSGGANAAESFVERQLLADVSNNPAVQRARKDIEFYRTEMDKQFKEGDPHAGTEK